MQDSEIRRLDLKARLLASEIIKLEENSYKTGQQLETQQKIRLEAEQCWKKLLKKALEDNKNAPLGVKKELLLGNLQNLSAAKHTLSNRTIDEQVLRHRMADLASTAKKMKTQIEHLRGKLVSKKQVIEARHDSSLGDDLASLKFIKHKSSEHFLKVPKNPDFTEDQELCSKYQNAAEKRAETNSSNSASMTLIPPFAQSVLSNDSAVSAVVSAAVNVASLQSRSLDSAARKGLNFDPASMQQRWESAEKNQKISHHPKCGDISWTTSFIFLIGE